MTLSTSVIQSLFPSLDESLLGDLSSDVEAGEWAQVLGHCLMLVEAQVGNENTSSSIIQAWIQPETWIQPESKSGIIWEKNIQ